MRRVEFAPAARTELDAAVDFYERDYPGRGWRFYGAVERAVRAVAATPHAGPPYPGIPEALGVRRRIVRGFPFVIAYRIVGTMIRIDAVAHTRRRPDFFLRRIR